MMKKVFYVLGIVFAASALFFGWQKVSASADPIGTMKIEQNKTTFSTGDTFTITVTGNPGDGRMMYAIIINDENDTGRYYYNCVTKREDQNFYTKKPDPWPSSPPKGCTFSKSFTKTAPRSYQFSARILDLSLDPKRPYSPHVFLPPKIVVSVMSSAVLSGNDICGMFFTDKDGQRKSADQWCKDDKKPCHSKQNAFCVGNTNTSYSFGCWLKTFACDLCNPKTAKEIKNDLINCPNPQQPRQISPANNNTVLQNSNLLWDRVPDAASYKILEYRWKIYNLTSLGPELEKSGSVPASQNSVVLPSGLTPNNFYEWTVRAVTVDGRESLEQTTPAVFKLSAPTLPTPPPGAGGGTGTGRSCPAQLTIKSPHIYQGGGKYLAYDGLVPCGKCLIVQTAAIDKNAKEITGPSGPNGYISCQFCHFFVMFKGIVDWTVGVLAPIIALLMLTIGGAMFYLGGANPSLLQTGKDIIKSVIWGIALVFGAFIIVNTILAAVGLADFNAQGLDPRNWFQFPCQINI